MLLFLYRKTLTADVAVPVEEDTVDAASPVEKHNLEDIPEDTVPVVVSIQVRSSWVAVWEFAGYVVDWIYLGHVCYYMYKLADKLRQHFTTAPVHTETNSEQQVY